MPQGHSDHTVVAQTTLVCNPTRTSNGNLPFSVGTGSPLSGRGPDPTPRHSQTETHGMVSRDGLTRRIEDILLNSRNVSTRRSYARKWDRFLAFRDSWTEGDASPLHVIFAFLLHLLDKGLAYSSLQVYLVAISAHHPPLDFQSVFSHPLTKRFLRGLARSCPVLCLPTPL